MLPHLRLHRWLTVPILLLLTACCLKNPAVYFSTGTTVGLEATPPVNETPPTITFGYKRAELALVPVTKLDKELPKPAGTTPGLTSSQSGAGSTSLPNGKTEQTAASSERGCSETIPPKQAQGDSKTNRAKDAFSVLAVFHLAVNWFGPAKIEQYFATGCAARHLIRGLTQEEEDKRGAEEAGNDVRDATQLIKNTKESVDKLLQQAQTLETTIRKIKDDAENASSTLDDQTSNSEAQKEAEKKLKQLGKDATELQTAAMRLQLGAGTINRLEEAKTKAQSAIEKADKATRTEEIRSKAQKTKEAATQLVAKIKDKELQVSTTINDARTALESVLKLGDAIKAKVPAQKAP